MMKKRLLIVDGDQRLNKVNEKVILTSGIVDELHFANNGREALEFLRSSVSNNAPLPDVIVFDLQMPVLNGFEFLDQFALMDFPGKSGIELIVYTASSKPSDKQKAISKGIKYYLSKPYLLRELKDILIRLSPNRSLTVA